MRKKRQYIAKIVAFIFLLSTVFANVGLGVDITNHIAEIRGVIQSEDPIAESDLELEVFNSDNQSIAEFVYGEENETVTDSVYGSVYAVFSRESANSVSFSVYAGDDSHPINGIKLGAYTDTHTATLGPVDLGTPSEEDSYTVGTVVYNVYELESTMTLLDITPPTASVTSLTVCGNGAVKTARSTETGTIYLLPQGTYGSVEALETALGAAGTKATIVSADTNTTITAPASDGAYKLYAVDSAGNISDPSAGTVTVSNEDPVILFRDNDTDRAYYEGDTVQFAVYDTNLPAIAEGENYAVQFGTADESYQNYTVNTEYFVLESSKNYKNGETVAGYVYFDAVVATSDPVMEGIVLRFGKVNGGTFTAFSNPPVLVGLEETIDESTTNNVFINFDFTKFNMPEGVTATDLTTRDNLRAVENLTFNREGFGTIVFTSPVNLLTDQAAQQLPQINQIEINEGQIAIPTEALSFLSSYGAALTMTELPFDVFTNIVAYNDDGEVLALDDLLDGTPEFDSENNTLTFTVNHFTTYQATSKLATPAKPTLLNKTATWTAVDNENNGYSIQLYKNDVASGDAVTVGTGVLEYDFTSRMTASGTYTVKVTAKGTGCFTDSDASEASDAEVVSSSSSSSDTTTTETPVTPETPAVPQTPVIQPAPLTNTKPVIQASVQVTATVEGQTSKAVVDAAMVSQILSKADEALANAKILEETAGEVETRVSIQVPVQEGLSAVEATLPATLVDQINAKGIDKIEITTSIASIAIPPTAINISDASSISLSVNKVDNSTLTPEQLAVVGDNTVYDFNAKVVKNNGIEEKVSNFNSAVEINVPYTLKEGEDPEKITVFFINDNGEVENKAGRYDFATKTFIFTTEHFSKYVVKQNNVSFADLAATNWAKRYIEVMASKGIVNGMSADKFAPNGTVTRAEFAAMLVRAFKVQKSDACITCKFRDTQTDGWYAQDVMSAVEAGLVSGYEDGTFRPNAQISRQEMAVMAARAAKKYKACADAEGTTLNFTDAAKIQNYAKDAVGLAVKNNIINGKPGNIFDPRNNATRAEAVKMIYVMYNM